MAEELPTSDEFFAAGKDAPTADEFFGRPARIGHGGVFIPAHADDDFWSQTRAGRVLSEFGHGFGSQEIGLPAEHIKSMRESGYFNDYSKGQGNLSKALLEGVYRPAAFAFDTFIRGLSGGFRAVQQTAVEAGGEIERLGVPKAESISKELIAGGLEAFQAGKFTGLPSRIHPPDLKAAKDLKVIGATEAEWRGAKESEIERVFRDAGPEAGTSPIERVLAGAPEQPAADVGIHSVARGIAPDLFYKYDEAQAKRDTASQQLSELNTMRAANDVQAAEIADLKTRLQEQVKTAEAEAREMAPAVKEAYAEANKVAPEEVAPPVLPAEAPATVPAAPAKPIEQQRAFIQQDLTEKIIAAGRPAKEAELVAALDSAFWETRAARFEGRKGTAEEMYRREAPEILGPGMQSDFRTARKPSAQPVSLGQFVSKVGILDNDPLIGDVKSLTGGKRYIRKDGEALDTLREQAAEAGYIPEKSTVRTLLDALRDEDKGRKVYAAGDQPVAKLDRDANLADIERALDDGLRDVGMDPKSVPEEVRARAIQIMEKERVLDPIAAYEKAESEAGLFQDGDIKRGRIRLREDGRNTITLLKDANASTLIHEKGHDYLQRLMRDAADPDAPVQLKTDGDLTLKWLGVDKAADIKAKQHEKFARGFENYLMEGRAPSHALARVFEQFRQWLLRIYSEATRLKAPLNDDIRGVFDRMLALKPEEVVIAPDRAPESMAGRHEAQAAVLPLESADDAALAVRAERDNMAGRLAPEEQDARLAEIRAGLEGRAAGSAEPVRPVDAAEPAAGGGVPVAEPGTVSAGGGQVAPQGNPVSAAKPAARVGTPESPNALLPPPDGPFMDKAGNIRLENLNTPEDVNAVLRQAADEHEGFITARRGVLTDVEVEGLADALGMDAKTLDRRKIGEAFNAEQIVAARKLLVKSAVETRDAMAKAATGDEAAIMAYAEAKARHLMIQDRVSGITAEAGRALRAFRAIEGMEQASATGNFLKQTMLKEATGKTLFQLQREAQLGMALDTPQKVSKFITDSNKPTWKDKVIEVWINALLSGTGTHFTNMIGNTITSVMAIPETAIAGVIGTAAKAVGREQGVHMGEAGARLFEMVQGAKDGVRAGWEIVKNEDAIVNEKTQVEQRRPRAVGGVTGKVVRIPARALAAEDQIFRGIAFRQEIAAQAYRAAANENLSGHAFKSKVADLMQNPTEGMVKAADENASYQTYQKKMGQVGNALSMLSNSHPLAKLIMPFVKTPTNLFKYAGERSPFGLFSQEVRNNLMGRNGAAARDTQAARIVMGTALSTWAVSAALDGTITGGGPTDPAELARKKLDGWRPYSVRIGDHYYSYASLEPFSTLLGVAADMAEVAKASTDEENENIGKMIFASVVKNLKDKTSLRGPSDLIKATSDPDRYGDKYVQRMLATVVPTFVADAAKTQDPYLREARTTIDAIKARIPGLSKDLFYVRDVWGEPVVRDEGVGPSRIYESRIKNDPVNQALDRLQMSPGKLKREIKGVELTEQQYDDYARLAGRTAKMRLDAAVNQPGFASLPAFVQRTIIEKTFGHAREEAAKVVQMQYPEIIQQAIENKREILTAK